MITGAQDRYEMMIDVLSEQKLLGVWVPAFAGTTSHFMVTATS
jgi:hypothetical protein